jgi:hypothetical protein
VLPEAIELVERGFAREATLNQETADDCTGATNACPAVHIHAAARLHGVVHTVEDLGHVHALCGGAVVLEGFAEVLDAEGEIGVVGAQLA